jgi:hypothetical protein
MQCVCAGLRLPHFEHEHEHEHENENENENESERERNKTINDFLLKE